MSIIKHVTLQKIVAHDFRYDPRMYRGAMFIPTILRIQKYNCSVVAIVTNLRLYQQNPVSIKLGGNVRRFIGTRDGDKGIPSSVVSTRRGARPLSNNN